MCLELDPELPKHKPSLLKRLPERYELVIELVLRAWMLSNFSTVYLQEGPKIINPLGRLDLLGALILSKMIASTKKYIQISYETSKIRQRQRSIYILTLFNVCTL